VTLVLPTAIAPLLAKPVAVFGGGVSGDGVRALLGALGIEGRLYDAAGTTFSAEAARQHALVVHSPGFAPEHPWLVLARSAGLECLGELDFAALFWRGQVVAITGTNGKTTLTEFVTHALRASGQDAHATGNIGYSFSRLATELAGGAKASIAVCEVSSFQAETLKHFRATTTLWTNFAEDHLERHPGLEAYFGAKWNLVVRTAGSAGAPAGAGRDTRATPAVFLGSSVCRFARKFERPLGSVVCVETEAQPADPRLAGTVFAEYPQRENFLLALAWWRAQGLDEAALYAAAGSFQLGRHRMTRVAELGGVTYWNDSKATNFHAVEAALARFTSPVVLIAGGKSKGGDLAGFVHRIAPRVQHVVLIGATSPELAFHASASRIAHSTCASLDEAVRRAAELAPRGGHVLLSPGFASFDQFRNYEDRGDQFEKLVHALGAAPRGSGRPSAATLR
jgi:UDP-N-acetylmuramoylalanine--D-glutamate ligase